jgi:glycosyltransferase involved in cell wall biosynthesis
LIDGKKVYVGIIAYNAERTLERVRRDIPDAVDYIVVSDDCSSDGTAALARRLGLPLVAHERNLGYGANQKSCYRFMLRDKPDAEIFVMLHGDFQYDPRRIPALVAPIAAGEADVVFGVRRHNLRRGGMPLYKIAGNKFLNALENGVFGRRLADYSTGYKAYSRRVLEAIDFSRNSDGFLFDEELNAQFMFRVLRVGMADVETRYFDGASSAGFGASVKYGLGTLLVLMKYCLAKTGLARPRLFFPAE